MQENTCCMMIYFPFRIEVLVMEVYHVTHNIETQDADV